MFVDPYGASAKKVKEYGKKITRRQAEAATEIQGTPI
jgi:hypothetical protein